MTRLFFLLVVHSIFFKICFSADYVVGRLFGQLGNQMFQIAAATSLAIDNNAIATFPDLLLGKHDNIPFNRIHVFNKLDVIIPETIFKEYKEPCFEYKKIPYHPNIELDGYFQSERYFKHNKAKILELFKPSQQIEAKLVEKYSQVINHPKSVAIHIRTYHDTTPNYHPFVGWRYFYKALRFFDEDSLFVVFSDNLKKCENHIKKLLKNKNYVLVHDNSHIHDFYLISFCKNQIISNSSFSWWAAYLNSNRDKIVISPSPKKWFGKKYKNLNPNDLLPEEWVTIPDNEKNQ